MRPPNSYHRKEHAAFLIFMNNFKEITIYYQETIKRPTKQNIWYRKEKNVILET